MTTPSLADALKQERLEAYARLSGGFPIPMAGTLYWAGLGALGFHFDTYTWSLLAFMASGLIFPMALGLARLFGNDFMTGRTSTTDILIPAFIGMFLFWPMAIAALWTEPELVPLILAIGLSLHWPVIGWSYGRTALFSAHAIVRAALSFGVWLALPEARTTLLPFAVAGIYAVTVMAIIIDSRAVRRRLAKGGR